MSLIIVSDSVFDCSLSIGRYLSSVGNILFDRIAVCTILIERKLSPGDNGTFLGRRNRHLVLILIDLPLRGIHGVFKSGGLNAIALVTAYFVQCECESVSRPFIGIERLRCFESYLCFI